MIIEEIDRAFFEYLRRAFVESGNLPDITLFSNNKPGYSAARQAIINDPTKQLIDVYGVGVGDARGVKDHSRITIDRGKYEIGSIGGSPSKQLVKDGLNFKEVAYGDTSRDITYELRVISQSTDHHRFMEDVVNYIFGERRYVYTVADTGLETEDFILIQFDGSVDVSITTQFKETLHRFIVKDVWLMREKVLRTGIKPMSTVEYFVYLKPEPLAGLVPDTQTDIT